MREQFFLICLHVERAVAVLAMCFAPPLMIVATLVLCDKIFTLLKFIYYKLKSVRNKLDFCIDRRSGVLSLFLSFFLSFSFFYGNLKWN